MLGAAEHSLIRAPARRLTQTFGAPYNVIQIISVDSSVGLNYCAAVLSQSQG